MAARTTNSEPEFPAGGPGDSVTEIEHAANPLQRLIQQRLKEAKLSYGDVARRGGLPRSTVYTLATTGTWCGRRARPRLTRSPRDSTCRSRWFAPLPPSPRGLHYYDEAPPGHEPGDQERDLLIASIDELSSEDRRHVAALVESLRKKASQDRPDD